MSSREMKINQSENTLSQTVLWTAIITPFTETGAVDFADLKQAAIAQASANNGILLLGSTGEGLALTSAEQLEIVEFICQLNLNVPLMVAVGGFNLAEQVAWIEKCNEYNIDAYLLGTPIYAKPGPIGQTQWFSKLLDTAKYPCMLYNVPSRSGVEIPLVTAKALQSHPKCWAMKEASGDLAKFLAYRAQCPDIALFSGEDAMLPYLVSAGAQGLVSVCANAWPMQTSKYVELCLQGKNDGLFPVWQQAVDALFQVANPIPVKVLMQHQGIIKSPILRPPLTHIELAANNSLIEAENKINQWFAHQSRGHAVGE